MAKFQVHFLACKVFEGIVKNQKGVETIFLDYGLHTFPKKLNQTIQDHIDSIHKPSIIVLGYGLCGNGLDGIEAGEHTLIIPKADDCVAIFMGSRQRYLDQFKKFPGTYYLTKGWFEVGSDPLSEYEKLVEKYGSDTADYLMEVQFQHYRNLIFVAHNQDDLKNYRPRALEVASYCKRFDMKYEEYLGSDDFIQNISHVLDKQPTSSSEAFIVIQPGGVIRQKLFR